MGIKNEFISFFAGFLVQNIHPDPEKRLTPKEKDQFWLMGNKAFVFDPKPSRIYPQQNLFSHILGQTDDTNIGISGVEKFAKK